MDLLLGLVADIDHDVLDIICVFAHVRVMGHLQVQIRLSQLDWELWLRAGRRHALV